MMRTDPAMGFNIKLSSVICHFATIPRHYSVIMLR